MGSVPERAREDVEVAETGGESDKVANSGLDLGVEEGRDTDMGRVAVSEGTAQRLASSGLTRYVEDSLETDRRS